MAKLGQNMSRLKRNNRALLLSLLHQDGPMSRLDMSVRTGLTPATISGLTREMIDAGIVREMGPDPDREPTVAGRKPILLDICSDSRLAAGLVFHRDQGVRVGIMNLRGRLLEDRLLIGDWQDDRFKMVAEALELLNKLISELGVDPERLLGLGVGIAGLVEAGHNGGIYPNYLKPVYASLRDAFQQQSRWPVFVDNNVKAMALGEMLYGAGRQVSNMVFFKVGPGIGSAVVLNGVVYRGSHQGSGEIGHTVVQLDGPTCLCGRRGCLEALASPRALVARARARAVEQPDSAVARLVSGDVDAIDMRTVLEAAAAGDTEVAEWLTIAGRYLGAACANLVNLFDPDVVVLHGGLFGAGPPLSTGFEEVLHSQVYSQLPKDLCVRRSALGEELEVTGAASLALDRYFFSHRLELGG